MVFFQTVFFLCHQVYMWNYGECASNSKRFLHYSWVEYEAYYNWIELNFPNENMLVFDAKDVLALTMEHDECLNISE